MCLNNSMRFLFLSLFYLASYSSDITSHFFLNGEKVTDMKTSMIHHDGPAILEFYFTKNETNEVITDYKIMHGKYMHMVIVKKDLSSFKHIHPYFDPVPGRFQITLNMKHHDPDNFDVLNIFDGPGMYMVMVDIEPRGIGMRMFHHHLHLMGKANYENLELKDNKKNDITKTFENGLIQANLQYSITTGCGTNLIDFDLDVKIKDSKDSDFKRDYSHFEDWLMTGGHSIWMSENSMHSMAHMHAKLPPNNEEVLRFSTFDKGKMKPGLQKIWFQFKYKKKVRTLDFVIDYDPPKSNDCN